MADEPQRIAKVVAALLACSRREAEQYVAEGWVRVDGQLVEEPQARVLPGQRVEVDPKAKLEPPVPATMLLHKPAGVATADVPALLAASTHWAGDTSGVRRVKSHAVGLQELLPLPSAAEGLCVFSQDGRIVRKLREDAALLEQELVVQVDGTIAPRGLERLSGGGLLFEGQRLPAARVSWQSEQRLRFAVKNVRPDVVPWMCEQVGLRVTSLRRIRIGRVPMAALPAGQWRYLAPHERF